LLFKEQVSKIKYHASLMKRKTFWLISFSTPVNSRWSTPLSRNLRNFKKNIYLWQLGLLRRSSKMARRYRLTRVFLNMAR
jgi:hypothetical protein